MKREGKQKSKAAPNHSVEATATRHGLRLCRQDIGRRIGCRRQVLVAAPHL
jgi:hypothetical protein